MFDQSDTPDRFRVEPFRRQKHQRKIGRAWRVDVFLANVFRALFQLCLQTLHRVVDRNHVAFVLRCKQALIILGGKFRIDRQPDRRAVFVTRQFNCELHTLRAVVPRFHISRELVRRQHLFEQIAELYFTPAAAHFYIAQYFL